MAYSKYYQQELYNIRDLAREFAERHPAIAPMLSGQSTDPDVERLLEGTAFLTGLLRQKLDDSLPELIHFITDLVFPHFLRPIPSLTLVRFSPRPGLHEILHIPRGTSLRSVEVEGTSCLFRTCFNCDIHPLRLLRAETIDQGRGRCNLDLHLELIGGSINTWNPDRLSFFLGGSYSRASELFMLLGRKLRAISLIPGDGLQAHRLPPTMLHPAGLERANALLPFSDRSFGGFRILQEYFILPHKFLYVELHGLNTWRQRGDSGRFTIRFEIGGLDVAPPEINLDSFILSTVPAINLFSHEAEPVLLDHRLDRIRITPAMREGQRPEVYAVDRVTGFSRGAVRKKEYRQDMGFHGQAGEGNTYTLLHSMSAVHDRPEVSLRFSYPPKAEHLVEETLTVHLTCTNGDLPVRLGPGDIRLPTADSPEMVDFSNLMQPTQPIDPPLEGDTLWRLLSHLSLNLLSLTDTESLRRLLGLYIFSHGRDRGRVAANEKRLAGIEDYRVSRADMLVRGRMLRGHRIDMVMRADHFAGLGDFWLMGLVLDEFFSDYAMMNSFTQLNIKDGNSGEVFTWPARIGDQGLK